jgi:hypothetical protein
MRPELNVLDFYHKDLFAVISHVLRSDKVHLPDNNKGARNEDDGYAELSNHQEVSDVESFSGRRIFSFEGIYRLERGHKKRGKYPRDDPDQESQSDRFDQKKEILEKIHLNVPSYKGPECRKQHNHQKKSRGKREKR